MGVRILPLAVAVFFAAIASSNTVQRSKHAQHVSMLRNKKPPARRWPRKAVGRKPGGNDRSDFSASTRAGDGFILSGAEDLVKVHSPNVTTYSAQGASWTENHTAKKMLPDIERATCLESAAMERRGEGACVWSQTTCHPFMLQKLGGSCEPNQCDSPCASARESLMRSPPLRPACRVPTLCYDGPKVGLRATTLSKPAKMCGFDDMAHSAFDVKPLENLRPLPSETGYERSFYVYGFGGQKERCEFYHVWVAVVRYFALVYEEFGGVYPSPDRLIFAINGAFETQFRRCNHVKTLFAALSPRQFILGKRHICFTNAVFGLPKLWLGNWNPLPWRPVSATFVQALETMRTIFLRRVVGWTPDFIEENDNPTSLCAGDRKPKLFFVLRPSNRAVQGSSLFVDAAKAAGFDVYCGDHVGDLATQMARVATHDVLIGRHGAGLVWAPMLRRHGVLVEMVARGLGNTAGEYFARWDPRDPHYTLYTNWGLASGKAYHTWEATKSAPGLKQADWKWSPFIIEASKARAVANILHRAVYAAARCPNSSMPEDVAHWTIGEGRPDLRPNMTRYPSTFLPPYVDCAHPPCGWRTPKRNSNKG